MENKYIIPMIDRALQIMDFIYHSNEDLGVSKIAKDLSLPKATVYRILYTLEKWGFIERRNEDKYYLGKSFIKYGYKIGSDIDIVKIASPYMDSLARTIGETVNLGMLYDDCILTIYSAEGEDSYLISKLIPISPLNCSSMGKLYLARYEEERLKSYFINMKLKKRTKNSITKVEDFLDNKQEIDTLGISYDREEYEYGLTCLSMAIEDKKSNIVAAISISGPTSRLEYKNFNYLEGELKKTKELIETEWNSLY